MGRPMSAEMTPHDVISQSLYAVDEEWGRTYARDETIRDQQAHLVLHELRIEYDTITLNGQRYLLLPEPSPPIEVAA
jgi:hypothetical protein